MKPRKLDIFALLKAIDRRDFGWLARQPEDVRKEFVPLVTIRWAASCKHDSEQALVMLWLVNERVNRHLFELYKHPDLVYRLLASCGTGTTQRAYLASEQQRKSNKALDLLREHHPLANHRELKLLLSLHSRHSFADFVADCGIQKDEAKEVMKAYDAGQ